MTTTYDHGAETRDKLEAIIDGSTLSNVVEMLAVICHEKAEHVRSAWQDEQLARTWARAGSRLDTVCSERVIILAGG